MRFLLSFLFYFGFFAFGSPAVLTCSSSPTSVPANSEVRLRNSVSGSICTLVSVSNGVPTPLGRSYSGYDWESVPPLNLPFSCQNGVCSVETPEGDDLVLSSKQHSLNTFQKTSRFLTQATFGPTKKQIEEFVSDSNSPGNFVKEQMEMEPTLHRKFFRSQSHARMSKSEQAGKPTHPCLENSRWRSYAVTKNDMTFESVFGYSIEKRGTHKYVLKVNGVPRTELRSPPKWHYQWNSPVSLSTDTNYQVCFWFVEESLGGYYFLRDEQEVDGGCFPSQNPTIQFPDPSAYSSEIIFLSLSSEEQQSFVLFNEVQSNEGELMLSGRNLTASGCSLIPDSYFEKPVVAEIQGQMYMYDPNLVFYQNTLDNPRPTPSESFQRRRSLPVMENSLGERRRGFNTTTQRDRKIEELMKIKRRIDEAKKKRVAGLITDKKSQLPEMETGEVSRRRDAGEDDLGESPLCGNTPRTFVNEKHCRLSFDPSACSFSESPGMVRTIDEKGLFRLYSATGRYPYIIYNLPLPSYTNAALQNPCSPGVVSRWIRIDEDEECLSPLPDERTRTILIDLLDQEMWKNAFVIDITAPEDGCTVSDSVYGTQISFDGSCFHHVHKDTFNVYDFTDWASDESPPGHPGNPIRLQNNSPNPIKFGADSSEPSFFLRYPAGQFGHDLQMWETSLSQNGFSLLGQLGLEITFDQLPDEFKTEAVAELFGVALTPIVQEGDGVVLCGSPGEVSNQDNLPADDVFEIALSFGDYDFIRASVFTMTALNAHDQLRQRVAWALSQILVVSPSALEVDAQNELFLNYYDIFVRHAFGNYRDILKEVTYSPLMARMLSYMWSMSTYIVNVWQDGLLAFPDENYAREIMQLFTIGLVHLNPDGTPVLDANGDPIQTYTNEDIISFARAWTGFSPQEERGNTEASAWWMNSIDPMKLVPELRDFYPKMNLYGGYIGDEYPLCGDLPARSFLKKGAKYRLLGSLSRPELISEPEEWPNNPEISRLVLDKSMSELYRSLCQKDGSGNCQFPALVVIDSNLECHGVECEVDTARVVQMGDAKIYYEYVKTPCVELAFIPDAKKVKRWWMEGGSICANPKSPVASAACCHQGLFNDNPWGASNPCKYVGERMTYDEASHRCDLLSRRKMCDWASIAGVDEDNGGVCSNHIWYHWTDVDCQMKVKIFTNNGKVSLVHDTGDDFVIDTVSPNAITSFRVAWENGEFPATCENPCSTLEDGGCLCPTTISQTSVIRRRPLDLSEISSATLHVGAADPTLYHSDMFQNPRTWTDSSKKRVRVWIPSRGSIASKETVFEVTEKGVVKYFRNIVSKVHVTVGGNEFIFRNPPHFMGLLDSNAGDAHDETDALLDHLFYHDNTAPFISYRLIQRFGISNPSPRYLKTVAAAFTNGHYMSSRNESFGTGKYGDLGATVAAILLDREARSVVLDADPAFGSLREPLLKVLHFMRSMEFQPAEHMNQIVRLSDMERKIGEEAHNIQTVFSFFLPEFSMGNVAATSLVSPEAYVLNTPKAIGLVGGLDSLVKYGLAECDMGFARDTECSSTEGYYANSEGKLTYSLPRSSIVTNPDNMIQELNLLLTAGRLSTDAQNLIKKAVQETRGVNKKLRVAQQLMASTPEFHTTNLVDMEDVPRGPLPDPVPPTQPYKAIVFFMLSGGADTYNLLVPYDQCHSKDLHQEYMNVRGVIGLPKHTLLPIDASGSNQPCNRFGLHPALPALQQLYGDGDASFFANTGVLYKPSTRENYEENHRTELFAHNVQQRELKRVDPYNEVAGTGVLGRLAGVATNTFSVGAVSVANQDDALRGVVGVAPPTVFVDGSGVLPFNPNPSIPTMDQYIRFLNNKTATHSGLFGELWSSSLVKALNENEKLDEILSSTQLNTENTWVRNQDIEEQMAMVAKLMKAHERRGTERDVFYVDIGGFDSHSQVENALRTGYNAVNEAIEGFVNEMKAQGIWDSVTVVMGSEFARTLSPNSGAGSDHAWGGNYGLFGGDVAGGKIHGKYPDDLTDNNNLMLDRGRIVPTTSWTQVWNGISQWFGVTGDEDLNHVCPHRSNFADVLFSHDDLFKSCGLFGSC